MKKYLFILLCFQIAYLSNAQTKGIQYQAVIQDPNPYQIPGTFIQGQALQNKSVTIRFTLKSNNLIDYEELHETQTDEFGLINLTIGRGKKSSGTNFDQLVWSGQNKILVVSVKIDGQANFLEVSNQTLLYSPYALYAEAVEYKNVNNAPRDVSHFTNDVGYLVSNDLKPLEKKIADNQTENLNTFTLIKNQQIALETKFNEQGKQLNETVQMTQNLSARIDQQNNQINQNQTTLINQINSLGGSFESLGNKSAATDLGNTNPSNQLYPSQRAVKTYVDQVISTVTVSGTPDATNLASGKIKLAGDLAGTASNPTVPGLAFKEDLNNKTLSIPADGTSDLKYPSARAVKTYVDQATQGIALSADLNAKADKNSPIFTGTPQLPSSTIAITQGNGSNSTQIATTAFVQNSIAALSVNDASNSAKGIIQLAGDLSGTAASPSIANNAITTSKILNGAVTDAKIDQVSGAKITGDINGYAANVTGIVLPLNGGSGNAGTLTGYLYANGTSVYTASTTIPVAHITGAELIANKSTATDLGNSTPSDTFYPSQKAVKSYVDVAVSGSVGGATLSALNLKENSANKSDDPLGTSSTLFPTQNAVKTYVDAKFGVANYITFSNLPLMANGTVLGNFSGSTSSPTAVNTIGSGNLVRSTNPTLTSPVLNGTISGSTVIGVANGGLGTNTMSAGYVKAGNPFFSISTIPVSDVSGAVQKVNGITPDGNGNVSVLHGTTYTGIFNGGSFSAVSSPTNSDIYIVSADPTPTNNGRTFIFDGANWNEISTDQAALDARYVRLSGGAMSGNLSFGTGKRVILQDAPSADTDAVNKAYVDNTVSTGGTPDASSTTSGKIKLAGDLTGTASSPSIAPNAISTLKIADGAITDAKISGILSASKGGTGVNNSGNTITLGGNLVLNGAYATNLTVNSATSLTLPSSGTLSTLTGSEDLLNKSINGVRPMSLGTGFTLSGGTISKTLTVANDASISGSNTGDQTISLSGDVIGNGTGAISATLANSGVVAGNFGSASQIPLITVDSKGRITSISNQAISATNPTGTMLANGKIWIGNGTNEASPQTITGDISLSNTGVVSIGTGRITNSMLEGSINLSTKVSNILSVSNGGTGLSSLPSAAILVGAGTSNITSINPGTDGQILVSRSNVWNVENAPPAVTLGNVNSNSTAKGFTITAGGEISLSPADATNAGIITTAAQTFAGAKTFASIINSGNLSVAGNLTNSTLTASKVVFSDASKVLSSTGTVGVDQGGTGLTSIPLNGVVIGNGTNSINTIVPTSSGQVLTWNGTTWGATVPTSISVGSVGTSTTNGLTISNNVLSLSPADATNPGIVTIGAQTFAGAKTFASIINSGNLSVAGNLTNSTLTASKVVFSDASKNLSSTGTVGVDQGGTGASTLSSGALLVGNGTGAITTLAPSTAGYVLKVVGSSWTVSTPDRDESEQFTATAGQTTFTLTQTPVSNSKVKMFINGIRIDKNAYTLSSNTITYVPASNSSFTLEAGDRIQFDYAY